MKDIHFVSCHLNNCSFLDTVSNKEKLKILDLGGCNYDSNFQGLLWKITQLSNLEWASLDGIKASNDEKSTKTMRFLPKSHTFAVNNDLVMSWEWSLDILQIAYWMKKEVENF